MATPGSLAHTHPRSRLAAASVRQDWIRSQRGKPFGRLSSTPPMRATLAQHQPPNRLTNRLTLSGTTAPRFRRTVYRSGRGSRGRSLWRAGVRSARWRSTRPDHSLRERPEQSRPHRPRARGANSSTSSESSARSPVVSILTALLMRRQRISVPSNRGRPSDVTKLLRCRLVSLTSSAYGFGAFLRVRPQRVPMCAW